MNSQLFLISTIIIFKTLFLSVTHAKSQEITQNPFSSLIQESSPKKKKKILLHRKIKHPLSKIKLQGIAITPQKNYGLIQINKGTKIIDETSTIKGWKVKKINKDRIIFKNEGKFFSLKSFFKEKIKNEKNKVQTLQD